MVTENETKLIEQWNHEQLQKLGVQDNADFIALIDTDPHDLDKLLKAGCPLKTAIRILA